MLFFFQDSSLILVPWIEKSTEMRPYSQCGHISTLDEVLFCFLDKERVLLPLLMVALPKRSAPIMHCRIFKPESSEFLKLSTVLQ